MKSWKIGAVSGLIAGIVAGIFYTIIGLPLLFKWNLGYFSIPPPPITPFTKIIANEIINKLIWGTIIGVIYARVYSVIPVKGVMKGIIFGLFNYLIFHVFWTVYSIIYWVLDIAAAQIIFGLFFSIPFGIVLGVIYEFLRNRYYAPKKEPKIIQYDMMSGLYPGAIAGFIGGVASFITYITYSFGPEAFWWTNILIDYNFLISQFGSQIIWHMMRGTFFGLIYPKVYNLVPGRGIIKGLCYGLIVAFLWIELIPALWYIGYGNFIIAHSMIATGGTQAIVFGIVLGLLYRKPPK